MLLVRKNLLRLSKEFLTAIIHYKFEGLDASRPSSDDAPSSVLATCARLALCCCGPRAFSNTEVVPIKLSREGA